MTRSEYNKSVDAHADGLFRFILKNVKDEAVAQDIVQDAFTKLWEKHENVEYSKVKSYLFTSGYHAFVDYFRRNKRVGDMEEVQEQQMSHSNQYSDLQEILHEALDQLKEVQKNCILLRDYEGYSYKEIGEILNLGESQVKVYIFRARKFLQNYLKSIETVV